MLYPGLLVRNPIGHKLLQGLQGYWPLSEDSGSRLDLSGNNNTLTDNNTVTGAVGPSGKLPLASDFELDNSESLSITDNASLKMGDIDFTVCVFAKLESKPAGGQMGLIGKWLSTGDQRSYILVYNTTGAVFRLDVSADGIATTSLSASTFGDPNLGTWVFIRFWHDAIANTINIQVNNGAVDSAAFSSGVFANTAAFNIGMTQATTQNFDGNLAGAAVWKRVLTARESTFLYNGGAGRSFAPGRGFY